MSQAEESCSPVHDRGDETPLRFFLHLTLFLLTFFTTTIAGVLWLNRDGFDLRNFPAGLPYSISLLCMLAAHEFGHYFAARFHGIRTTLPFFIPIPPFLVNPFGTMGAVIRIRSPIQSKKALFDIGIAGPLAGLAVTVAIILLGFFTLPEKEYIYSIHPEYALTGQIPETGLTFGHSLLTWVLAKVFSETAFVPPMNEIYHYPFLCVGWFGLFVTSLNLIPVGQLDGGHILYAISGKKQGVVARAFVIILILLGISGFLPFLGVDVQPGTVGWLLWAAILIFIIKLDHPPIAYAEELDQRRSVLGWITFGIFMVTFAPIPFFELSPH